MMLLLPSDVYSTTFVELPSSDGGGISGDGRNRGSEGVEDGETFRYWALTFKYPITRQVFPSVPSSTTTMPTTPPQPPPQNQSKRSTVESSTFVERIPNRPQRGGQAIISLWETSGIL